MTLLLKGTYKITDLDNLINEELDYDKDILGGYEHDVQNEFLEYFDSEGENLTLMDFLEERIN